MNITYEDDYALKTIFDLALHEEENVHISEISQRQDIPLKFLEQVLLKLKKAGFVISKKGPNGGYRLLKKPAEITLKDVLESIGGPYAPIECAWNSDYGRKCGYFAHCVFREVFSDIYRDVSQRLKALDFETLKKRYLAASKPRKRQSP